ncbi:class I SAM-dependent methyltransferase [Desulfovibrio sp.]|uniref:class I SAM-dependent methyltransferase n=1 Tax=Desulfovibrio sp. TaxID=885 RepID=UPI0025C26CD1|nr:class I SAM-dependent methyltransferase [Desulfovibrio sp.]
MTAHSVTPTAVLPFAALSDWLVAPVRMALLSLALELELPDILDSKHSLPDIAASLQEHCGKTADTARLTSLMDAMAAAGLALKNGGRYANSPFAGDYLRKGSPAYLGDLIASLTGMQHRNLSSLRQRLFDEVPAPAESRQSPRIDLRGEAHWKRSMAGLAAYQKAGAANSLARLIAALPGAARFTSMLDLGCGPGITALYAADMLPGLHVTLCDFAPVLDMARAEAKSLGLCERVCLKPGDFNECDLGLGYDLVWACQSLYYANDLHAFIKKVHRALRPGGMFVSVHEGVQEGIAPAELVLSRLSLAMEGQDVSLAHGQMAAAATAAGLERISTQPIPMLFGEAHMEVFQKSCGQDAGDNT